MSTVKMLFFALLLVFTTACSTVKTDEWFVSHNGNMPTEERISQISKGDSQDKVLDILGAPSSIISLDRNTWIYMSSDIKRVAFFAPKEVNRDVLTIRFDSNGKVSDISRHDNQKGEEVAFHSDETEAPGQEPGFFRKYFGGVGQYNPLGGIGGDSSY